MNLKELTDLLVTSSERLNETKFIPWWEGDHENAIYRYDVLSAETIQDAEACIDACSKEELLSPVGVMGFTLFHLLVWHNFYNAVKKLLCDGKLEAETVNLPDHKGYGITPFMIACCKGNLAMFQLLREYGADDSLCDERGMNAYHFLAYPRYEYLAFNSTCLEHSVEQRSEIARLLTCDINKKNKQELTPLEQLLSTNNPSFNWTLAEIFLDKGAKTDYTDEEGNTLLMLALKNGYTTAALKLMKQCPELLDVADQQGRTPAKHAISFRNQAMYIALTDHGAAPVEDEDIELFPLSQITDNAFSNVFRDGKDALSIALYLAQKLISKIDPDDDDDLGEVASVLHHDLRVDDEAHVLYYCKEAGIDLTMPFHYHDDLCLRDDCLRARFDISVIKKLVELGVDMDMAVANGQTPANILACDHQGDERMEAFLGEAVNFFSIESMEQLDKYGRAAIHYAAENGHTQMLKAMLEKGVDANITQDKPADAEITALHCACKYGQVDAVKLLIDAGADDTLKNLQGETPAHYAVMKSQFGDKLTLGQRTELLKTLKNIDLPRQDGKTPLLLIQKISETEQLLPILIERGVNVNHADNEGVTAMMLNTDKNIIKLLLQAGADINMVDNAGNTVLHYVLKNYNEVTARYLIKKGADYNRANNEGVTPVQIAVEKGMNRVLELMTDIQ